MHDGAPLVVARGDAQFLGSDPDNGPDVAGLELVAFDDIALGLLESGGIEGHAHLKNLGGVEQPLCVFFESEYGGAGRGLIGPHPLKNAHTVVQGVGQHMNLCIAPRHEFSIHPDPAITIGH